MLPVGLALALAFALGARSSPATPLQLGPIVVADGTATVNGTVGGDSSSQTLTVNRQPVGLDAAGHFATTVNLNGASTLDFGLTGQQGNQSVDFQIPLGTLADSTGVSRPERSTPSTRPGSRCPRPSPAATRWSSRAGCSTRAGSAA